VGASKAQRRLCQSERLCDAQDVAHANGARLQNDQRRSAGAQCDRNRAANGSRWPSGERNYWSIEPDVGRVAYGVPSRVDRLRALGNAVVPQVVEAIGKAIMQAEGLTGIPMREAAE
jgi:DNA (cytosine-5)-methyltransferase 1